MESQSANQLIKLARKRKGLTQQELADQAGVSLRTVQRIEKGTEEISGFSGPLFLLIPLCYYVMILIFTAVNYIGIRKFDKD